MRDIHASGDVDGTTRSNLSTLAELKQKFADAAGFDVTPAQVAAAIVQSLNQSGPRPASRIT
jgi:hypothetical protein